MLILLLHQAWLFHQPDIGSSENAQIYALRNPSPCSPQTPQGFAELPWGMQGQVSWPPQTSPNLAQWIKTPVYGECRTLIEQHTEGIKYSGEIEMRTHISIVMTDFQAKVVTSVWAFMSFGVTMSKAKEVAQRRDCSMAGGDQ